MTTVPILDLEDDAALWATLPLEIPGRDEPHECEEWAEYLGGCYSVEPHGETHWDEGYRCKVCGGEWSA